MSAYYNLLNDSFWQSKHDPSRAWRFLEALSGTKALCNILSSLLLSSEYSQEVAERSFAHPNGFDRIDLIRFGRDRCSLRLHIWWPENRQLQNCDAHNHSWDFYSKILSGSIEHCLYEIVPETDAYLMYHCTNPAGRYNIELRKRVGLRTIHKVILNAGASYFLYKDILHTVYSVSSDLTLTLVIQNYYEKDTTIVCARNPLSQSAPKSFFSSSLLREKISRVLNALDSRVSD